ncbi:MAG: hypothetical protein D3916_14710, partial [Candidatus Electrothrix sp. MAN1_4]|nr:hypothetical protein [Candidatus Electrothrix sp. MAN1_4]
CKVDQEKINSLHLPDNIIDMMLLRTKGLDEEIEQLLKISAVIGKEFKLYLLYHLIKQDDTAILQLIEQAVQKNLLEYSLSDRSKVQFVHDRIRETFLVRIEEEERREYHLKIARLLQEQYRGNEEKILFELTYHLIEGRDEEDGLKYALRAGKKAKTTYAYHNAIAYYIYAKKILNRYNERSVEYLSLLENLGESFRLVGEFESSISVFNECITLISENKKEDKSRLLSKIGETLFEKGETEKSFDMLEKSVRLSGINIPRNFILLHIALLVEFTLQLLHTAFPRVFIRKTYREEKNNSFALRALNRLYEGYAFKNPKKGLYCHLKSLNIAESLGPCSDLAHSYVLGGIIWSLISWRSRALRDSSLGLKMSLLISDRAQEGFAYLGLSIVFLMLNRTQEGLENSRKAIQLLKGMGEYWELGVAYVFRIQNCLVTGRLQEALQVSEDFISLAKELNALQNLGWALMLRGKTLSHLGDITERTIKEIKESSILMERIEDKANFLSSLTILSAAYLRKEEYLKAISTIEKAVELFPSHYSNGAWNQDFFPLGAQVYLESVKNTIELTSSKKKEYLKKAAWFCKKSL